MSYTIRCVHKKEDHKETQTFSWNCDPEGSSPEGHYKDSTSHNKTSPSIFLTDTTLHLKCFCTEHTSVQVDGIKSRHKSGKGNLHLHTRGGEERERIHCMHPVLREPGFVRNGDHFTSQSSHQRPQPSFD